MIDEQADDLEQQVERGRKMKSLVASQGWDLLEGYIKGGMSNAVKSFKESTTLDEFIAHRQALNTLEAILNYVVNVISTGESARKQLYPQQNEGENLES